MSNNQTPPIRRRWSFEKGRNSSSVFLAAVVTAVAFILLLGIFRYDFRPDQGKTQMESISLIRDQEALLLLDRYDPAHTFNVNNGGIPFCLQCRRSHYEICPGERNPEKFAMDMSVAYNGKVPDYPAGIKNADIFWEKLPAKGQYAEVLPFPADRPGVLKSLDVFSKKHGILRFPALEKLDRRRAKGATVLKFTGSGLLMRGEVIVSCGDAALDRQAVNILKASGVTAGEYTVNWHQSGDGK